MRKRGTYQVNVVYILFFSALPLIFLPVIIVFCCLDSGLCNSAIGRRQGGSVGFCFSGSLLSSLLPASR